MAAISSSAGFQAITQAAFQQMKVQQARQNADRAEQLARDLAAKANQAQEDADRAQNNARDLTVRSGQAQTAAGKARQGLAVAQSVTQMQSGLYATATQVSERIPQAPADGDAVSTAVPVVNSSGQTIGTTVNVTA